MKVIDPGHRYLLATLDSYGYPETLQFVKRIGFGYPGNAPPARAGTTIQEVLRVLIDRLHYVGAQAYALGDIESISDDGVAIAHLRAALLILEERAARRHGRELKLDARLQIEQHPACERCGHIGCEGKHR